MRRRFPEILVPVIGIVYAAALLVVISIFESPPISAANPYPAIAEGFAVLMLVSASLMWRRRRAGFVVAIVIGVIVLALFSGDLADALTGFADLGIFLQSITLVPILLLVVVYSILAIRRLPRKGMERPAPRTMQASTGVALVGLGVIAGGALIGTLASGVETRLLANAAATGDVTIIRGASDPSKPDPFTPASLSIRAGRTITWVNRDVASHTVTSSTAGTFDSGSLPTGATFKFTFARAGTYDYYCTVHAWMKGTVVVSG